MFTEANVTVMVVDINRAIRFYTEQLGLALKPGSSDQWAEVQAAGMTIGLHPADPHAPPPGRGGSLSIGLAVDNLDDAIAALKAKGVEFDPHITTDGPIRLAFFSDPDGTPLYLSQLQPYPGQG